MIQFYQQNRNNSNMINKVDRKSVEKDGNYERNTMSMDYENTFSNSLSTEKPKTLESFDLAETVKNNSVEDNRDNNILESKIEDKPVINTYSTEKTSENNEDSSMDVKSKVSKEATNTDITYTTDIKGVNAAAVESVEADVTESENPAGIFGSFSGVVQSIKHFYDVNNRIVKNHYFMDVVNNNETVTFFLSSDTYYADCNIRAGDRVVGYFRTDQPVPLIYPPRHNIRVLARVNENRNTKTDFFNNNLISSDGSLKLNITGETFVMNENGRPYCRGIAGSELFVIFGASTRSIPAITNPSVVVVLR